MDPPFALPHRGLELILIIAVPVNRAKKYKFISLFKKLNIPAIAQLILIPKWL